MASEIATRSSVPIDIPTLAKFSAAGTGVGAVCFVGAVLATQGVVYPGYVSETGVAGQPYASLYRLGIFGFAAGLVLLAAAFRLRSVLAALVLLTSGLLAAVSGSVACSEGCPLPPFENSTPADLVHGGASVAGVGLCALAILVLAVAETRTSVDAGLRRLSRVALIPIIPVGLLNVYGLAFVGRGLLVGVAERLLLVLIVGWCLAVALRLVRTPAAARAGTGTGAGAGA